MALSFNPDTHSELQEALAAQQLIEDILADRPLDPSRLPKSNMRDALAVCLSSRGKEHLNSTINSTLDRAEQDNPTT